MFSITPHFSAVSLAMPPAQHQPKRVSFRAFGGLLLAMIVLASPSGVQAGQVRDTSPANGLNVEIDLRHRIVIPPIIYLRIGSPTPGEVDKVKFDLSDGFTIGTTSYTGNTSTFPIGDGNPVAATQNGTLDVDVRGNVGDIAITYEVSNTSGLDNGNGQFIPFEEIQTDSSDPTNLPAPALENNGGAAGSAITVIVPGHLFSNKVVNRQAAWTYTYKNQTTPLAGTYEGRVTYTASVP